MKKYRFGKKLHQVNKISDKSITKSYNKSHVPFRLNLLFFIIFSLFVSLIVQLGYLQLVNGDDIRNQLQASSVIEIKRNTPRGMIYDASENVLVENKPNTAITFTRGSNMTAQNLLETSLKLSKLIDIPIDSNLTERDLKDYWLANEENLEKMSDLLDAEEKSLPASEQYTTIVNKVSMDNLNFSDKELESATIFKKMNAAQLLSTVFIKSTDIKDEELALVAENLVDLPGISTGTDWTRNIVTDSSLASLIGLVTTEEQGVPEEMLEDFLDKGYARNDRVGRSYLEKQYEEVLQGEKSVFEISLDSSGNIESQIETFSGKKGKNLVLTLDLDFQVKVDQILKSNFQKLLDSGIADHSPGIYAVALNPKTGGVLSMSGYKHIIETSSLEDDAIGTFVNAFVPGSVVKAGTLAAGWENGVLKGNESLMDQPIRIGSDVKASIFNPTGINNRSLSADQSLEVSSNSYMMQVAFRLMGIDYQPGIAIPTVDQQGDVYDKLRSSFASFGMGIETGIDIPGEATGISNSVEYMDPSSDGGKILDLSFGQFDTYTTLQLAQYAATVANGGKRLQPHIVAGIYDNDDEGALGSIIREIEPTVLNEVGIKDEQMKTIQNGFYKAVHGNDAWTTAKGLASSKMEVSAKTGTAETMIVDENGGVINLLNLTLVAYGPSDDADIAIAIVIPQLKSDVDTQPNIQIAKEILDLYHEYYVE